MADWYSRLLKEHINFEKCVDEYLIWDSSGIIPHNNFGIKVYEQREGIYIGKSSVLVIDTFGDYCGIVGVGSTVQEAVCNTITSLFDNAEMIKDNGENKFESDDIDMF